MTEWRKREGMIAMFSNRLPDRAQHNRGYGQQWPVAAVVASSLLALGWSGAIRPAAAAEPDWRTRLQELGTGPAPKRMLGNPLAAVRPAAVNCATPANAIVAENCLQGTPSSVWQVTGAGDPTLQGFATDISYNKGDTVAFKIDDQSGASYAINIYRLGYYGGNGARLVATIPAGQTATTAQPPCASDPATGLVDCGNWSVTATWTIPSGPGTPPSGIYMAQPVRSDTGGASQIFFVVRNDAGPSDLLFKTSDTTWHAYNDFGGNSLYAGGPGTNPARAYKVSYNRPFNNRNNVTQTSTHDFVFYAEYPMIRWLEANGYDVSYMSTLDMERGAALLTNHKAILSVGHDEYWPGGTRNALTAARDAGVHLGFFSANTGFWKVRWEPSTVTTDGSPTDNRTMVCYKETFTTNGQPLDPADPPTSTATWRDPRFGAPADGYRPENALNGTLFNVNETGAVGFPYVVTQADGLMRFWRNTSVARLTAGSKVSLNANTLGYEYDSDVDNGFRPAGIVRLSTTPLSKVAVLEDSGATYISGNVTHNMTLYKAASGALVFSAGSVQWSWGLDGNHDGPGSSVADLRMQQATVNLFADMGAQPATLQTGLMTATASTDTTAPVSTITSPAPGAVIQAGLTANISGTATDAGGGVVGGVEYSTDGGATWHPANGRGSWSGTWLPVTSGPATLLSRAVDDSGNIEAPSAGNTVTVTGGGVTLFPVSAMPGVVEQLDPHALDLGIRFYSDQPGVVRAIRFYAGQNNTGTHTVSLWTNAGKLLGRASATALTGIGWQQLNFTTPVAIQANTYYVASYHTNSGYYSSDDFYFTGRGINAPPLHAPADGQAGGNGLYIYAKNPAFPNQTYQSENYWVDVVFSPN